MVELHLPSMYRETRVTASNQTQVPAELRTKHKLGPGDVVVWEEAPDGTLTVRFRRRYSLTDITGLVRGGPRSDAVDLKKRAQRGDSFDDLR